MARSSESAEAERDRKAELSRQRSESKREVGRPPPPVDPKRKARCKRSLLAFCRTYFPKRFSLKFSPNHLLVIDRMQECARDGGLFSLAMPRGAGKTSIADCAVLWAVLYGFRRFVVVTCATGPLAERRLKSLLRALETNRLLADDFPEVCHFIRALQRVHNRCAGQMCNGVPTRMEIRATSLVLPTYEGSAASGALIQVAGLEGAFRGLDVSGPDGEQLRPDMVVIDDAQTRESAKSVTQTADREAVVMGDILGLAGPDVEMACIMLCTVIYPGDLSDRFLNDELHPEWQGVRTKTLDAMPADMELWDRYAEVRKQGFRARDKGKAANAFYKANRKAMDAGAVATWPERKKPGEVSAIQSAMNWYYRNRRAFLAEGQNQPEADAGAACAKELAPAEVAKRLSGLPRGTVPPDATRLTAFVDVGGLLHWYCVCAWSPTFGGSVIDYGTWPRQNRSSFAADDPRPSLADAYPRLDEPSRVYAGLSALADAVLGREYAREGTGERLGVELCLVDAGWQSATVYNWCRQTPHRGLVLPSKGVGRTTTARGISEWKPRPGERAGWHWRLTMSETGKGRMCQFDPDQWKTFVYERLTAPLGGAGCLLLPGTESHAHELFCEHLAAEGSEPVTLRGTTFDKWQVKVHRPDNHWLDCLVGCAVAAAVRGLTFDSGAAAGSPAPPKPERKKVRLSELYAAKHGRAG